MKIKIIQVCVLLFAINSFSKVDTIETNLGKVEIKKSDAGIEISLGLNWMNYFERTNNFIPNHAGPVLRIGGFRSLFHLSGFFKPWSIKITEDMTVGTDTLQQNSSANPIRTGLEFGISKNFKMFGVGVFSTYSAFLLTATETLEGKSIDFPPTHFISLGVEAFAPILKTEIKTTKRQIEKGQLLIKPRVEYYFGDLSNTYFDLGKNGISFSIEISYRKNQMSVTLIEKI